MAEIVWTEPALEHLREIADYVAKKSPAGAADLIVRIQGATDPLHSSPRLGRVVPGFGIENFRELIVRPYRLMYVVRGDTCEIVAVIHGSRDITNLIFPESLDLT